MKYFSTKAATVVCLSIVTLPMFRAPLASTIDRERSHSYFSNDLREAPVSETDPSIVQLNDQISKLVMSGVERSEDWGALVVSLEHGDTLFSYSKDKTLSPASNMKTFYDSCCIAFSRI